MATMFHPPTTLEPVKQDDNFKGNPSDHNVIVVAPKTNISFKLERHKKKIHKRPLPKSKVADLMRDLGTHDWSKVTNTADPHVKAYQFHSSLITTLNKHFKEKTVTLK